MNLQKECGSPQDGHSNDFSDSLALLKAAGDVTALPTAQAQAPYVLYGGHGITVDIAMVIGAGHDTGTSFVPWHLPH